MKAACTILVLYYLVLFGLVYMAEKQEDHDIENSATPCLSKLADGACVLTPIPPVKPKPRHKVVPKPQLKYEPVTQKSLDSLNAIEATAKETASDYVDQPNHQIVNDAKRVIDIAETMKLLTVKDKTWYELDTELYDDQVTMFADVRHYESEQTL